MPSLLELLAQAKPDALSGMQRNNLPVPKREELRHTSEADQQAAIRAPGDSFMEKLFRGEEMPFDVGGTVKTVGRGMGLLKRPVPRTLQRIEKPGVPVDFNKPQGVFTSPAGVESPHAFLGGKRSTFDLAPDAKILSIDPGKGLPIRQGAIDSGAGVHAAKELLGPETFESLRVMSKPEISQWASRRYPGVDFSKSDDAQDVLEKIGGLEARKAGFDAVYVPDPMDEAFDEVVLLSKRAIGQ
jgi:hypothetical protein